MEHNLLLYQTLQFLHSTHNLRFCIINEHLEYDRKYHKPHSIKPDNYEENLIKFIIVSAFFPRHEDSCAKNKYEYFFIFFTLLVDNMKIYSYTIDCKTKKQDKREICEILLNMALFMGFL